DLITVEVEQLLVDVREPGLPTGLHGDSSDEFGADDPVCLVTADEAGDVEVGGIAQLADDVVPRTGVGGTARQCERGLDDISVGIDSILRPEKDDAARRLGAADLEIAQRLGVARAANDRGLAEGATLGADLVL